MSKLTQKQRLLNAILKKPVDKVPVMSMTQTGTLELMKAINAYWPKANKDAKLMAELAVAAHSIAGLEAVRVPFGLTMEAATMGCEVDYHEDRNDFTPNVKTNFSSYDNLRIPEPTEGMMGVVLEAVKICRDKVGYDVPIVGGVTGPFTIAGQIRGINEIMMDLVRHPEDVHDIEEVTWQVAARFTNALAENGLDVVVFIEPTASIIGKEFFSSFVLPYMKKIMSSIKIPAVLHVCGSALPYIDLMIETGVNGVSIDQKVNMGRAKDAIKGRCSAIGNVDPVAILQMKGPDGVIEDCMRILHEGTDILAPGCGISPYTPTINIRAMIEARDRYSSVKM